MPAPRDANPVHGDVVEEKPLPAFGASPTWRTHSRPICGRSIGLHSIFYGTIAPLSRGLGIFLANLHMSDKGFLPRMRSVPAWWVEPADTHESARIQTKDSWPFVRVAAGVCVQRGPCDLQPSSTRFLLKAQFFRSKMGLGYRNCHYIRSERRCRHVLSEPRKGAGIG